MLQTPRYAEFFCGAGMVRAALADRWACVIANDIDAMKGAVYRDNWGADSLVVSDIADLSEPLLHQPIDLYWASSPCQDFSLAGRGLGLSGARSGVFRSWVAKIKPAIEAGFAPRIIAFENVTGLMSRNAGSDFSEVLLEFMRLGYRVGALEIDAAHFLPQSRPRLFVVAVHSSIDTAPLEASGPTGPFHSRRVRAFFDGAPEDIRESWIWWRYRKPTGDVGTLSQCIDRKADTPWLDPGAISRLISMMSAPSLDRVATARQSGRVEIGALYKRGRPDNDGKIRQRAEVRFDGRAGCLRTPAGGSSRQTLLFIKGRETRARLLSKREAMRLMGLDDSFLIPENYNNAYRVAGDGVAVPVVTYLDQTLFQAILKRPIKAAKVA